MSGINASSIIYVGVAPVLWLLYAVVVARESTWRRARDGAAHRRAHPGACLWWIAGLEVEAAYGVNVLKFTETVPSTSATSSPAEVIRGLGYWYFYGGDRLGAWTGAAGPLHPGPLAAGHLLRRARPRPRGGRVRPLAPARLLPAAPLGGAGPLRRALPLRRPDRSAETSRRS